jgi:hypothetical protein
MRRKARSPYTEATEAAGEGRDREWDWRRVAQVDYYAI